MSVLKQILLNTFSGWLAVVARAGIAFFMIPFLLNRLGKDGFGFIGVLGVLVSLAQVADLGLRGALGRELAAKVAANDWSGYNELTTTALFLYLCIAAIMSCLLGILSPWLVTVLKVPDSMVVEGVSLLRLYGSISIFLSFVTPVFTAVLSSFHRFDLVNAIQVSVSIAFSSLIFIVVSMTRHGLWAWILIMIFDQIIILVLTYFYAKRTAQLFRIRFAFIKPSHLVPLFALGSYLYTLQLTSLLSISASPLIISFFFGPAGVAFYQPGARLSQFGRPIVTTLSQQLLPLTTREHVRGDSLRMLQYLVIGTRYTLVIGALSTVAISAFAFPLARVWLPEAIQDSRHTAAIVIIGCAFADFTLYISGTQWPVLLAMKRLRFLLWITIPTTIINVAASVYLVGYTTLGIIGAVVATIVIGFIKRPLLTIYTARICGIRPKDLFFQAYARPLLLMAFLGMIGWLLNYSLMLESWASLGAASAILFVSWVLLAWFIVVRPPERRLIITGARRHLNEMFGRPSTKVSK